MIVFVIDLSIIYFLNCLIWGCPMNRNVTKLQESYIYIKR